MGNSAQKSFGAAEAVDNTILTTLGARLSKLEDFLKLNNVNINLTQAYQKIGLLYYNLKNTIDIVREDLDVQVADFEQLKAYVNSLVLNSTPPEVLAEFDRIGLFISSLFENDKNILRSIERTRPVVAFGSMGSPTPSGSANGIGDIGSNTSYVTQQEGTVYRLTDTYASDTNDIQVTSEGIIVKTMGTYRASVTATIWGSGGPGGSGTEGFSEVGLYVNGQLVYKRLTGCAWGYSEVAINYIVLVNSPNTRISIGCAGSWRKNEQRCVQASLHVERLFDKPVLKQV